MLSLLLHTTSVSDFYIISGNLIFRQSPEYCCWWPILKSFFFYWTLRSLCASCLCHVTYILTQFWVYISNVLGRHDMCRRWHSGSVSLGVIRQAVSASSSVIYNIHLYCLVKGLINGACDKEVENAVDVSEKNAVNIHRSTLLTFFRDRRMNW